MALDRGNSLKTYVTSCVSFQMVIAQSTVLDNCAVGNDYWMICVPSNSQAGISPVLESNDISY